MFIVSEFTMPRRKRQRNPQPPTEPRVIVHLRRLLDQVEAMTDAERNEATRVTWVPRPSLVRALLNTTLKQRDRVELIIIHYKRDMAGDSPSWDTVAAVLGIAQKNARTYGLELLKYDRAEIVAERFQLKNVQVQHPLIR